MAAFVRRHLERAARVGRVQETGEGFLTALEHPGVARPDLGHLGRVDLPVVQRRAPVRRALTDRQINPKLPARNPVFAHRRRSAAVRNRDYVASPAIIEKTTWQSIRLAPLGQWTGWRGEPVPRTVVSGDVGDGVVGQDGLGLPWWIMGGWPDLRSRRLLRRPQTQVAEDFADDCRIVN